MANQYRIAFWNLENLFDVEGSPRRTEKVARTLGTSIKGWSQTRLNRKIRQLAGIIRKMGEGKGPDILGVADVENQYVLELLVKALALPERDYHIVYHETEDSRGIDVAFVYDANHFTVPDPASEADLTPEHARLILDQALARLSPEDRLIITLLELEDRPVREIAELTGWGESRVKVRAFRARKALKRIIGGDNEE